MRIFDVDFNIELKTIWETSPENSCLWLTVKTSPEEHEINKTVRKQKIICVKSDLEIGYDKNSTCIFCLFYPRMWGCMILHILFYVLKLRLHPFEAGHDFKHSMTAEKA